MEEATNSDISDAFSEVDLEGRKDCSVLELISFLKSAFRHDDFAKAEGMLILREENREREKAAMIADIERSSKELEVKLESEFWKRRENLEKELEGFRCRFVELSEKNKKAVEELRVLNVDFEIRRGEDKEQYILLETKLGEMEFGKLAIEEELEKYKKMCGKLKERVMQLEEDHQVVCGREQRAKEKIAGLEEEIRKKEKELQGTFVQLKVENRDLECSKMRFENEIEDYKRRCGELEAKVLQLEVENSFMHSREQESQEKIKVEPRVVLGEVCCEDEGKKGSCKMVEHQSEMYGGKGRSDTHLQFKGKILNHDELVHASADVGSARHSPVREKDAPHIPATPHLINVPCKSFRTVRVENIIDSLITDEDHVRQVRKKLSFNEGSSDKKHTQVKPEGDVVVIIDSDDEVDTAPTLNSNVGNSGLEETYGNLKGIAPQKSLKRMHSDQKSEAAGEENASSCEENIPLSSTPKRKRASNVITSDNEEEDDDKIPIGELKVKKLAEVTDRFLKPSYSPVNQSSVSPTTSSSGDNVEKFITPSRRRIISLRQCEETKCRAKKSNPSHSIGENLSPKGDIVSFGTSGTSYRTPQKTDLENPKEDEVEEVDSDSEGESLGGFIVQESDGSDSEGGSTDASGEEAESGSSLNQLLLSIRRKKKSSKWEYEADMLSSFAKDPELCMKAVCALYRQQTSDEKSMKGSLYANNRGFNKFDALKGSNLAEFLTDGDPHGPLKKSVEELEKHNWKAIDYCSQLASRYSKQLFEIYQNKEDPHFLPC